jgi:hypothetical protein
MKNFRRTVFFLLALFTVFSGCSPDSEAPIQPGESPEIALSLDHDNGPFCKEAQIYKMVDDNGDTESLNGMPYGKLFAEYNMDSTYFTLNLGPGWFVEKAGWFIGPVTNAPITQNGFLNTSAFPESFNPLSYVNNYTFKSPFVDPNSSCHDVIFWCEIVMVGFFQGPIQNTRRNAWASQSPYLDGYMVEVCYEPCYLGK